MKRNKLKKTDLMDYFFLNYLHVRFESKIKVEFLFHAQNWVRVMVIPDPVSDNSR